MPPFVSFLFDGVCHFCLKMARTMRVQRGEREEILKESDFLSFKSYTVGRYTFYTPYVINIDVGTQIILHHACYNCKFEKKKDVIDFIEEQGNEERILLRKTRTLSTTTR